MKRNVTPKKARRKLRRGLRFCFFDPDGKKIATEARITGKDDKPIPLPPSAEAKPGTYHLSACSVGDLGDDPLRDELRCQRPVLEYSLTVR